MAADHPTEELSHLVTYVMKAYALVWFIIQSKPSCKDGARHVFQLIGISRYLTEDLKNIVDPVIQCNLFFADPKNLLISMIMIKSIYVNLEFEYRHPSSPILFNWTSS